MNGLLKQNAAKQFDNRGLRIGVFVVAYDADSMITGTLSRVPEDIWEAIDVLFVIDDCSRDQTVERALAFGRHREKIVVLRNRVSQRYGGNLKIGFQYAIDRGLDAVVLLHADGKFAPECLGEMLNPIALGDADVVIGSRMLERGKAIEAGMPRHKYWGNRALSSLQNGLSGLRLSEFHSGYRAFRTSLLRRVPFWENTDDWHFDTQILLQARQAGGRIVEVPTPTFYSDKISSLRGIAYGINCLGTSAAYFLHRHGILYGRNFDLAVRGRKYFEKFHDHASSHSRIWAWLRNRGVKGKTVLELGVGDASLTRRLFEAGATVDGIEINVLSADLARPYCRRVMVNDLDDIQSAGLSEQYDLVIAADVLEHLRDPEFILSELKKHVKIGGYLVVSLPNVANVYVRLNLLFGRFPYHIKGILDRTHLHFFTLKTAEKMLVKTGWIVEGRDVTSIPLVVVFPFLVKPIFRPMMTLFWYSTRFFKGLLSYQGLYYCRNPNHHPFL
jgi:2-polyprenyl-3-methyl-5-hydroxy-6-metoxy-1,4-benzoquinol methylase